MLKRLIAVCSVCGLGVTDHMFALLASAALSETTQAQVTALMGHMKRHEWVDLNKSQGWKGNSNNLVIYVIKGDHAGGMVVMLKSPFELYEPEEVVLSENVGQGELAQIGRLVSVDRWQALC